VESLWTRLASRREKKKSKSVEGDTETFASSRLHWTLTRPDFHKEGVKSEGEKKKYHEDLLLTWSLKTLLFPERKKEGLGNGRGVERSASFALTRWAVGFSGQASKRFEEEGKGKGVTGVGADVATRLRAW